MTVGIMADNWGEARVRDRDGRRKRRVRWISAAVALLVAGIPFGQGFVDGLLHRPATGTNPAVDLAIGAGVMGLVLLLGALCWRDADEVQRRVAVNSWAAGGVAAFLLYPLMRLGGIAAPIGDLAETLWWVGLGIGLVAYVYQRVRA